MTQRRNLTNALTMTPDKLDFIAGQRSRDSGGGEVRSQVSRSRVSQKPKPTESDSAIPGESAIERPRPQSTARQEPGDFLGELLVPLTTRIKPATANALRRAYLEQKLRHAKPDSQQEIVEEALAAWFMRNGYYKPGRL